MGDCQRVPEGFDITHGGDAGEAMPLAMAGTMIFGKCGTPQKAPKLFFWGFQLISPQDRIPSEYHEYPISREFRWTCRGRALARHDIPKNSVFFSNHQDLFLWHNEGMGRGKPIKNRWEYCAHICSIYGKSYLHNSHNGVILLGVNVANLDIA